MNISIVIPLLDARQYFVKANSPLLASWTIDPLSQNYLKNQGKVIVPHYENISVKFAESRYCLLNSLKTESPIRCNGVPVKILYKKFYTDGQGFCKYEFRFSICDDPKIDLKEVAEHLLNKVPFISKSGERFTLNSSLSLKQFYLKSIKYLYPDDPDELLNNKVTVGKPAIFFAISSHSCYGSNKPFISKLNRLSIVSRSFLFDGTVEGSTYLSILMSLRPPKQVDGKKVLNSKNGKLLCSSYLCVLPNIYYKRGNLEMLFTMLGNKSSARLKKKIEAELDILCNLQLNSDSFVLHQYLEAAEYLMNPMWRSALIQKAINFNIKLHFSYKNFKDDEYYKKLKDTVSSTPLNNIICSNRRLFQIVDDLIDPIINVVKKVLSVVHP